MNLMRTFLAILALAAAGWAQNVVRWSATTGQVSLTSSGTAATVQQPPTGAAQEIIEQIVVYCSVGCTATQYSGGTAATATAGTVVPLLPVQANFPIPLNFYTASNTGTGTQQGGITNIPAGATVVLCLARTCGNGGDVALPATSGAQYTLVIGSLTGMVNITFYGRQIQ